MFSFWIIHLIYQGCHDKTKQETCRSIKLRELSACGRLFLTQRQLSVIAGWQHMDASSYRQPLEQEGDPMTWIEKFWLQISNCRKEVINVPPVPSISRCIHIVYRHKNVWEYQWSNFIYNCTSTFLHYVHCKDALLDCSAPGGERCESLTWVDEITSTSNAALPLFATRSGVLFLTQAWVLLKWKFTQVHI